MATDVNLDKIYYEHYGNLFYSVFPAPKKDNIKVAANQGVLKKGSLMWQCTNTEDGFKIAETSWTASAGDNCSAPAVLAQDIDTGTEDPIHAVAFVQGHFNLHGLIFKDEMTLNTKDLDALRRYDIFVSEGK